MKLIISNFIRFEHLSAESDLSKEVTANSDNSEYPQNAVFTDNLKSTKPKKIEKISQQSIHQKPRYLKEKNQKNKMNNNNNNGKVKQGSNAFRVNNTSQLKVGGIDPPDFNASRITATIPHKSTSLKNNSTLKQTFLNNSILPNYGKFYNT